MRMMLHSPEHRTVTASQGINFKGGNPQKSSKSNVASHRAGRGG